MRRRRAGRRSRVVPAVIGTAVAATLVADVVVAASGMLEPSGGKGGRGRLVSVDTDAAAPAVAPLTRLFTPVLLVAGDAPLPPDAVERARRVKGVAGLTVVDAAQAQVAGRRVGLLGVDPSEFRAFTPRQSAESDPLWRSVATGGMAVSFELSRDGSVPLGGVVPAGGSRSPGRVRVAAYASLGIDGVDAVVSRGQARALGMPQGNGLVVGASTADAAALSKRLRRVLPPGTRVAVLRDAASRSASTGAGRRAPRPAGPRVTGRPDGALGARSTVTGNLMTATMRDLVLEIDRIFGPFPTIGCYRTGADAQDHAVGRACDFMEGPIGRMPSASAQRHGDQLAQYAVANARRLGISYVIWKQHIWNVRYPGWRRMEDRGSITQNHYDHVHISVLE